MKFYILDNGWETLDKSYFIAGANAGTASNKNPVNEWIDIPIQAYLIKSEYGNILFDTGCDVEWKKNWPAFIPEQSPYYVTEEQYLLNRLQQLGLGPEDIQYVIISHLHVDHAGNLFHFTDSEVYVNENELLQTLKGYVTNRELDVHVPSDIKRFVDAELNWKTLGNDIEEYQLIPGVTILNWGSGHSFGMLGMKVELENTGNLLVVADAIYCRENIEPEIKVPGILYDSLGYKRTAKKIIEYARKTNSKIIFGHDMEQFQTLIKSDEGYYD